MIGQPDAGAPGETLPGGSGTVRIWDRWVARVNRMGEAPFGFLLMLPAAILLLGVLWLPIGYSIITSFQQVELTISSDRPWIGLANYTAFLTDRLVWESIVRTLGFAAITVLFGTGAALGTALTLNERFLGRNVLRVVILLPWAVASLVSGVMWKYLVNGKFGVINAILLKLGLIDHYVDWLANPHQALAIAAIATAWKQTPFVALMLLAALQSIPESLYRSAKMDGANVWWRFRAITFPHTRGIFNVVVVYQIISALLTFDLIYGFTKGGPGYGTTVINYLIYTEAFQRLSLGMASAMALMLTIFIMIISGVALMAITGRGRGDRYG